MDKKYLLISIAGVPKILSDFMPDNGLASLAGSLMEEGKKVKILDFNLPDTFTGIFKEPHNNFLKQFAEKIFLENKKPSFTDLLKLKMTSGSMEKHKRAYVSALKEYLSLFIEKENAGFLGFKLWAGEGFKWTLEIGRSLKARYPDLKVFAGGPQVDIFGADIYKEADFFDALCYGEGDESIKMLAEYTEGKERLENIPNIIFKRKGEIIKNPRKYVENLDGLPFPVYDQDVYINIKNKIKMIVLEESRGCPNACYFCIHPVKSGRRREKSTRRIIEEMTGYREKYGARLFRYAGSCTPPELIVNVAEQIIEKGLKFKYTSFGNIKEFDIDFEILKKSGCESLFFGVESANEEILNRGMNKKLKKQDMEKVINKCRQAGIFTVASIIFPAPFETESTRKETLDFLKSVRPDSVLVQFPGIYPGTMWFKQPERFNFTLNKKTYPFKVMNYQIKSLFPPRYWDPLPYKVNGMSFKHYAAETENFQKDLQKEGIETSISDEAYLLSKFTEFPSTGEFLKQNRVYFYSGQVEKLKNEIADINRKSGKQWKEEQ
jgi:radical SAM superfamily enzyme YgiQ (UPF0313 family)